MICLLIGQLRWRTSPARNFSRSGQLLKSGGMSFHSIAVLGKKGDLWALIREYGIENLFLRVGLS